MKTQFVLSSSAANLASFLSQFNRTATVEAEYGETCVEGNVLTLAHHGRRSGNQAPCLAENGCAEEVTIVGLSHLDLDAIGGCAAIMSRKPEAPSFWRLVAFIDVHGQHKLGSSSASSEDIRRLNAYWAWSKERKIFAPRDGSVQDVTLAVEVTIEILEKILADDPELLAAGDKFQVENETLNKGSFVEIKDGVIVRVSTGFSSHLYVTPEGITGRAIVALRTDNHACTVSLADPITGVNCREIVQAVWPERDGLGKFLADGSVGIAGCPRGKPCGLDDLLRLRDETIKHINFK